MSQTLLFKVRNDRGVCHQKYNKKMNLWSFEPWVRTQVTSYKQGKKRLAQMYGIANGGKIILWHKWFTFHTNLKLRKFCGNGAIIYIKFWVGLF